MSRVLLKVIKILALLMVVRCHIHIIRLIILATLGLGGLVLYQAVASGKPINHLQSAIGKRSISDWSELSHMTPSIKLALDFDERECARQYICQVAATRRNIASLFPNYLSPQTEQDRIALEIFKAAADVGLKAGDPSVCHRKFNQCPYRNIEQMQSIIERYKNA